MKNKNAYTSLETGFNELNGLYEREDAKQRMDSDLVTGHLDDLGEILEQLDAIVYFDGAS